MEARSECSHEDADNDRSACDSELDRCTDSRYDDRDASQYKSEDDADEQRQKVRVLELFRLVSKDYAYVLDSARLADDCQLVAELKAKLA